MVGVIEMFIGDNRHLLPLCISVDKYVKRRQRFSPRCHHQKEMHKRVRDNRDNFVE